VARWLLQTPPGLYLSSFKVLSRFLVQSVITYEGPFPYVDGLVLRSTQSIAKVQVAHADRREGRSNYTLKRLVGLWLNMFTGFSITPLRMASFLGLGMSALGLLLAIFFIVSWQVGGIFRHEAIPPGWASLIVTIVFFSGTQLLVLGVVGEYIGRLFLTQNRAPQFIVRETAGIVADEQEMERSE
jgi:undecaprenyl-phosphate 4-deoxy-4-formamido-L-arabinose transferase